LFKQRIDFYLVNQKEASNLHSLNHERVRKVQEASTIQCLVKKSYEWLVSMMTSLAQVRKRDHSIGWQYAIPIKQKILHHLMSAYCLVDKLWKKLV
jgi:hypothetical protein